jgi:hypothetical protein
MKTIKDFKYWLKGYLDEARKNNISIEQIIDDIATQIEQLTNELNINKIEKIVKSEIKSFFNYWKKEWLFKKNI